MIDFKFNSVQGSSGSPVAFVSKVTDLVALEQPPCIDVAVNWAFQSANIDDKAGGDNEDGDEEDEDDNQSEEDDDSQDEEASEDEE